MEQLNSLILESFWRESSLVNYFDNLKYLT